MWFWENVTGNFFYRRKSVSDKRVDLQSIVEQNSRFDSHFHGNYEEADSEINLLHHQLRNLAYYTLLIGSDDIGSDDPEPLDLDV